MTDKLGIVDTDIKINANYKLVALRGPRKMTGKGKISEIRGIRVPIKKDNPPLKLARITDQVERCPIIRVVVAPFIII